MIGFGVMDTTLRAAIIALEADATKAGCAPIVADARLALARGGYRHGKTAMLNAIERCKEHIDRQDLAREGYMAGAAWGSGFHGHDLAVEEAFRAWWIGRMALSQR